jgi:Tol biopolymer transport system component
LKKQNLFSQPADNSAASERLTTSPNQQRASSVASDGQVVFFTEATLSGNHDIWALPSTGDRQPHAIVKTRFDEEHPAISPDGRWLAYSSDETGRTEVYVQQYPGPGPKVPISGNGGSSPAWRKDGCELFYLEPALAPGARQSRMMAVNVATTASTFTADKPRVLFQGAFVIGAGSRSYDVSPDGQRFLMVLGTDRPSIIPAHIILVQNWFEELKRLAPNR